MTSTLRIGLAQLDTAWEDPAANIHRLEKLLMEEKDLDLLVLPEMWSTGFTMNTTEITETATATAEKTENADDADGAETATATADDAESADYADDVTTDDADDADDADGVETAIATADVTESADDADDVTTDGVDGVETATATADDAESAEIADDVTTDDADDADGADGAETATATADVTESADDADDVTTDDADDAESAEIADDVTTDDADDADGADGAEIADDVTTDDADGVETAIATADVTESADDADDVTTDDADGAEIADGKKQIALQWMLQKAASSGIHIAGSIAVKDGDQYYNRFYCVSPQGDIQQYDKKHLFSYGKEDHHYSPGREQLTFQIGEWRIRAIVCYDLRFPVWCRNTDAYDVLLVVANWPEPRIHHWDALLRARAIENQSFVVGVNRIGIDGHQLVYNGHSAVYDMNGSPLLEMNAQDGIGHVVLNKETLRQFRLQYRFLQDQDRFSL